MVSLARPQYAKNLSPVIVSSAKVVFVTGSAEQQQAALHECFDLAQLEEGLGGLAPFRWDPGAYFARDAEFASADAGAATPPSARTSAAASNALQP